MASGVEWIFELQDRMSGAASTITDKLKGLANAMLDVTKGSKDADDATSKAGGGMKAGGEAASGMGIEFGAVSEITRKVIDGIIELTEKVIESGIELGKTAIEASEMKRSLLLSFETLTGGAGEAADALAMVREMAARAGASADFTAGKYRDLLGLGLSAKNSQDIMSAALDVGAQSGKGQEGIDRFESMLSRIKTLGKLDSRELVQFGNLGIQPDKIYDAIAAARGITEGAAKKLVEAGKVSASESITAILQTVQQVVDAGGALGSKAMAVAAGSPTAQLTVLKDKFIDLFADVSVGPLANALSSISAYLSDDSETGKRFHAVIENTFNSIFAWIGKLLSGESLDTFITNAVETTEQLYNIGRTTWTYLEAAFHGAAAAIGPVLSVLGRVFGSMADGNGPSSQTLAIITDMVEAFTWVALAIGAVVGAIAVLGGAFAALPGIALVAVGTVVVFVAEQLGGLWDWLKSAASTVYGFGSDLVDGLWNGIKSGWAGMLTGFESLVGQLPQTVKDVLGIHSPSRVMMELGGYTAEGFDVGLQQGGLGDGMDVAPVFSPANDNRFGGGGISIEINVTVQGGTSASNAHETGQAIAKSVREELTDFFEEMSLETGNEAA